MSYSEKVKDLFFNPKYVGEIKNPDGLGKVGNPKCGDVMWVYIKVKDDKIVEIKFKTFGCAAAVASSEALCRLADGKTLSEAKKIEEKDIVDFVGGLPAIKFHCSVLGSDALKDAIKDYEKNSYCSLACSGTVVVLRDFFWKLPA